MVNSQFGGYQFTDADIVELDDWIPEGEYNPHKVRPLLISGIYGTCAVVFASCWSNALDIAADNDKLKGYRVLDEDMAEKSDEEQEQLSYLGNHGDPYEIDDLHIIDLPNPKRSFCAIFNAENFE